MKYRALQRTASDILSSRCSAACLLPPTSVTGTQRHCPSTCRCSHTYAVFLLLSWHAVIRANTCFAGRLSATSPVPRLLSRWLPMLLHAKSTLQLLTVAAAPLPRCLSLSLPSPAVLGGGIQPSKLSFTEPPLSLTQSCKRKGKHYCNVIY
jgi:hypothetical protein